jgi:hypothetical protein
MNFYSSLLFNKDKIFEYEQIPHVDMESLPCFTPVLSFFMTLGYSTSAPTFAIGMKNSFFNSSPHCILLEMLMMSIHGYWTG